MKYSEYMEASKRHLKTCETLMWSVNNTSDPSTEERLRQNIYYLSGYIIETIISYTIFYLIRYDEQKDIYKLDNDNGCGIKFDSFFRNHTFSPKIDFVKTRGGALVDSIPIIGNVSIESIQQKMFDEWKPDLRYYSQYLSFNLTNNNVKAFLGLATNIYKGLRRI